MKKMNKSDIVIVGGGITGLAMAYNLANKGENVIVVEKSYCGSGSTFRCASGIRQQFGDEANIKMMKRSIDIWKNLSEQLEYDIDFIQDGYLFLLYDEKEISDYKKYVSLQNQHGVHSKIIDAKEVKDIVPIIDMHDLKAASWNDTDGKANPFKTVMGYKNKLKEMDVEILEYTKVTDIVLENNKGDKREIKEVITDKGGIKTGIVVNCTNAWARELNSKIGIDLPILPYKHQCMKTEPFKYGQIRPMVVSFKHGGVYFTQEGNQGGIIGGYGLKYGPTMDIVPTYEFLKGVSSRISQIIPSMKYAAVIRTWAGYYAETPDGNPLVGKIEGVNDYYIAGGFSGHGFMLAPAIAEALLQEIRTGKTSLPLDFYDPGRFSKGEIRHKSIQMG